MKKLPFLLFTIIIGYLPIQGFAQSEIVGGNALGIILPSSSFSDSYVVGLNFNGNVEIPITNVFFGIIEVGVQSWSPQEILGGGDLDEENSYSVALGGKYFMNRFFIGSDVAYLFGDFSDFSVLPNAGLRLGKFNFELSASVIEPITYVGFEIGYFWAKN